MPEVIETTVYRLGELSDAAKDKARAWYREGGFDNDWYDAVYEDFQRIAEILGLNLKTRTLVRSVSLTFNPKGVGLRARAALGDSEKVQTPSGDCRSGQTLRAPVARGMVPRLQRQEPEPMSYADATAFAASLATPRRSAHRRWLSTPRRGPARSWRGASA